MPTDKKQQLLNHAFRYLKYRSRSRHELTTYLQRKTDQSATIDQVLDELESLKLIDDQKFAAQFAKSKLNKLFGPIIISYQLKSKFRVKPQIIDQVVANIPTQDWQQAAAKYLAKKRSKFAKTSKFHRRQQAYSYLYRRGFPQEIISPVIDELDV